MICQTIQEFDPLFDNAYDLDYHVRRKLVRTEFDLDDESMMGNSKYHPGNAKNTKKEKPNFILSNKAYQKNDTPCFSIAPIMVL